MSAPLLVLVVETIIILLVVVGLLLFFRWQKRKSKAKELEELLDNIKSQEGYHQKHLIEHLQKSYALDNKKAAMLTESIVAAEKQFLQAFIEQQVSQNSVADFYETLCTLLDQYLSHIPSLNSVDSPSAVRVPEQKEKQVEALVVEEPIEEIEQLKQPLIDEAESDWEDAFSESGDDMDEEIAGNSEPELGANPDPVTEEEGEPDWGEAFSESGDAMDESTKQGFDAETEVMGEPVSAAGESAAEPDWGEAFSESGDNMDEATKQGFESEEKKV